MNDGHRDALGGTRTPLPFIRSCRPLGARLEGKRAPRRGAVSPAAPKPKHRRADELRRRPPMIYWRLARLTPYHLTPALSISIVRTRVIAGRKSQPGAIKLRSESRRIFETLPSNETTAFRAKRCDVIGRVLPSTRKTDRPFSRKRDAREVRAIDRRESRVRVFFIKAKTRAGPIVERERTNFWLSLYLHAKRTRFCLGYG